MLGRRETYRTLHGWSLQVLGGHPFRRRRGCGRSCHTAFSSGWRRCLRQLQTALRLPCFHCRRALHPLHHHRCRRAGAFPRRRRIKRLHCGRSLNTISVRHAIRVQLVQPCCRRRPFLTLHGRRSLPAHWGRALPQQGLPRVVFPVRRPQKQLAPLNHHLSLVTSPKLSWTSCAQCVPRSMR